MRFATAFLLSFAFASPLLAQAGPDPLEFLPLRVGNEWIFERTYERYPDIPVMNRGHERWTVESNTVEEDTTVAVVIQERFDVDGVPEALARCQMKEWVESESVAGEEWEVYYVSFEELEGPCSILLNEYERTYLDHLSHVVSNEVRSFTVGGILYPARHVMGEESGTGDSDDFYRVEYLVAEGVGPYFLRWRHEQFSPVYYEEAWSYTLAYASVDGQEFGTPITVGVEEQARDRHVRFELAGPNPTTGLTRFLLGLASDQTVEIQVFDVLGRQVYHAPPATRAAGETLIGFDAAAWAPGVYVVHVRTGDAVHTAQFIRAD